MSHLSHFKPRYSLFVVSIALLSAVLYYRGTDPFYIIRDIVERQIYTERLTLTSHKIHGFWVILLRDANELQVYRLLLCMDIQAQEQTTN